MSKRKEDYHFISIAVVDGSLVELSKLDLSPWGIRSLHVKNDEFKDFIKSLSKGDSFEYNWEYFEKWVLRGGNDAGYVGGYDEFNILVPLNFEKPVEVNDYFDVIEAIRLMHPSIISIKHIIDVQIFDGNSMHIGGLSTYNNRTRWPSDEDWYKYHFNYPEDQLELSSKFLRVIKERIPKLQYVANSMRYYSGSFRVNDLEMSFVSLCICLESIVPTAEQLTFRFRRNLAVLCGENLETGKSILEKVKKLYNYRSKLVHFGMKKEDYKYFDNYLDYAQIIASRMLIEMIIHNVPTIKQLDERINELGIGEGKKVSKWYRPFKGNIINWVRVSSYKL
ncbi:hypothetical protein [Ekhidna sp.]|uniref:hypothetical protein n=1 Tax=Ekhidna sp. TaxID=2608089 RepID=UPI003298AED5